MLLAPSPKEHKELGRKVRGFNREKWDQREFIASSRYIQTRPATNAYADKSRIVEEGNWHKFTNAKESSEMQKLLLATGERELVEVRPTDTP